jgi:hypothetical protein
MSEKKTKKKKLEKEEIPSVDIPLFCCTICYIDQPYSIQHGKTTKNQYIKCSNCQQEVCITCQIKFGKGSCMFCNMVWKRSFIDEQIDSKFYETYVKPKKIEELLQIEKEKLPSIQPLVEWEKQIRQEKEKKRFGLNNGTILERPTLSKIQIKQIFPCPMEACRGFITKGKCSVCNIELCVRCHKKICENHICKTEDIQSICAIYQETKQCPRCTTFIYKTAGCNHMYCTNCHTHFDWNTGNILKTSTNGHYINVERFKQSPSLLANENEKEEKGEEEGKYTFSLFHPKYSEEEMSMFAISKGLIHSFYEDGNCIRLLKRKKYDSVDLEMKYQMKMEDYAIKYILNEWNEVQWKRSIYRSFMEKEYTILVSDILSLYLQTLDTFLESIRNKYPLIQTRKEWIEYIHWIEQEWFTFQNECNTSLKSIGKEYEGYILTLRTIQDSSEHPSFMYM